MSTQAESHNHHSLTPTLLNSLGKICRNMSKERDRELSESKLYLRSFLSSFGAFLDLLEKLRNYSRILPRRIKCSHPSD